MQQNGSPRPRVILASASVGAGHIQAARSVQAGLHQADPTVEVEIVNVLDLANPLFRLYYAGGYAMMMTRLPRIYGLGYRITDRPTGPRRRLLERRRLWTEYWAVRRFRRWLTGRLPALVLNTHFLSAPMIGRMIARGAAGLRQMVVVTDHHMHRFWCAEGVDRYFVPDEYGREKMTAFGMPADRVDVSGIPVHPKWTADLDAAAARADWDLPPDAPVVLVSSGVDFTVGRIDKLATELCRACPDAFVFVLAGYNKKLLARLSARPEAHGDCPHLRPVGFTDRVHELVALSDLVVTKTGALTVTECITRGAAMVLLKPVPGQEAYNARWLCDHGAAVATRRTKQVIAHVVRLLGDPAELDRLRANAQALALPATDTIVARILAALNDADLFPTSPPAAPSSETK